MLQKKYIITTDQSIAFRVGSHSSRCREMMWLPAVDHEQCGRLSYTAQQAARINLLYHVLQKKYIITTDQSIAFRVGSHSSRCREMMWLPSVDHEQYGRLFYTAPQVARINLLYHVLQKKYIITTDQSIAFRVGSHSSRCREMMWLPSVDH